jgi:hypothetical protein
LPRARWWASFTAQSWAHLVNGTTALSANRPRPQCAQPRTTTQRACTLRIAAGSGHIGNLKSTVLLAELPALRIRSDHPQRRALSPILYQPPCTRRDLVGPLPSTKQPKRTHAATRRTLSFTIASQTIASSPDGSVISSAASCACGPPAATVGCGWRFRASSTVTSSSSPCDNAFGHPAAHARSTRVCPGGGIPLEYAASTPGVALNRLFSATRVRREYPWSSPYPPLQHP